jgi:hypothetical protein
MSETTTEVDRRMDWKILLAYITGQWTKSSYCVMST